MGRYIKIFISTLLFFSISSSYAAIVIQRDFVRDLFIGPTTMLTTPGQAMTNVQTSKEFALPPSSTLNCTVDAPGCTGAAGLASRSDDLSISGVTATGGGTAGGDAATSTLQVSGTGGGSPGANLDVLSGDFQQLRFNVAGAAVPEFIDVDITFSISASVIDLTSGSPAAFYFPFASGGVEVLEASTLNPAPPSVFAAFSAIATSDGGEESLMASTEIFSARPNVDYWVRIITQANLTIGSGDTTGIDLIIEGFADPTFELNPLFAAANPDVASGLTIERISAVPLPASLWLFAVTFSGLTWVGRRVSRS